MSEIQDALKDAQRSGCAGWGLVIALLVAIAVFGASDRCSGPAVPVPSPSASTSK